MSKAADNAVTSGTQPRLIQALCSPMVYPHRVDAIRLIETHISWVFLTGSYAYKIKKPVNFGFLDFSSLEKRRICCLEEIRLNNRFQNKLYLELVTITGIDDKPMLGGQGEIIEYAVRMQQFPTGYLLHDLAQRGELTPEIIDQLALIVADFHALIASAAADAPYGEPDEIKHWFDENFHHIKPLVEDAATLQKLATLECWSDREWRDKSGLMRTRKQQGKIRECHGDLHLANITLIEGRVAPFDCIEFNPMLRWIDVFSELAFLVMDLLHNKLVGQAFHLLNRYLQATGDVQGLQLLRYYLVYRAMVRAKVALLRAQQCVKMERQATLDEFGAYTDLAVRVTGANRMFLLLTHGYSGAGKSTYAGQVAERFQAIHLRSDVERKRRFGYQALDDSGSGIASGIYTQTATAGTYKQMLEMAKTALDAKFPVIVDAAFLKLEQRELYIQAARDWRVPWIILDFKASAGELERRIAFRKNDPSEATAAVLRQQLLTAQALTEAELENAIVVDTESADADKQLITELEKRLL